MIDSIGHQVDQVTPRRFVFVIMPFVHVESDVVYGWIKPIIQETPHLDCLHAGGVKLTGHPLAEKIHELIDRADVVVAILNEKTPDVFSPNVFYEAGYAVAKGKPRLF